MTSTFRACFSKLKSLIQAPKAILSNKLLFDFRKPDTVASWLVASDKAVQGSSVAHLEWKDGHAKFYGNLQVTQQKDMKTGYCAIRSARLPTKRFARGVIDLEDYKALCWRIKGDGRTFVVNIQVDGFVPEDIYQLFLHTTKEWQTVCLPLDKFVLTYRGFIQTDQAPMPKGKITTIGILLADSKEGDFQLEMETLEAVPASLM